jgi:hypothetical protein
MQFLLSPAVVGLSWLFSVFFGLFAVSLYVWLASFANNFLNELKNAPLVNLRKLAVTAILFAIANWLSRITGIYQAYENFAAAFTTDLWVIPFVGSVTVTGIIALPIWAWALYQFLRGLPSFVAAFQQAAKLRVEREQEHLRNELSGPMKAASTLGEQLMRQFNRNQR